MSTVVDSAAQSGIATLIFALAVAALIIFILGSLLWWLVRERMRLNHERLKAGVERMNALSAKDDQQDKTLSSICTNYVHKNDCERERVSRDASREKLERAVDRMVEHQACFDRKISELGGDVQRGFKTLTGLVAKAVKLGREEEATP